MAHQTPNEPLFDDWLKLKVNTAFENSYDQTQDSTDENPFILLYLISFWTCLNIGYLYVERR